MANDGVVELRGLEPDRERSAVGGYSVVTTGLIRQDDATRAVLHLRPVAHGDDRPGTVTRSAAVPPGRYYLGADRYSQEPGGTGMMQAYLGSWTFEVHSGETVVIEPDPRTGLLALRGQHARPAGRLGEMLRGWRVRYVAAAFVIGVATGAVIKRARR